MRRGVVAPVPWKGMVEAEKRHRGRGGFANLQTDVLSANRSKILL